MKNENRYKSSKSWSGELLSLALVALVPLGIFSVFPREMLGHQIKAPKPSSEIFASFVFLTEQEEREAIARSRNAWQLSGAEEFDIQLNLAIDRLPESKQPELEDYAIVTEGVAKPEMDFSISLIPSIIEDTKENQTENLTTKQEKEQNHDDAR